MFTITINTIYAMLNFLLFVVLATIGGAWLANYSPYFTYCDSFLQAPIITIWFVLLLASIAGFFGGSFRISHVILIQLVVVLLVMLVLFSFTVFAYVVTDMGKVRPLNENKGSYSVYRLQDYPTWLANRVEKESNWNRIKSCIRNYSICYNIEADQSYSEHLSPIQAGCCESPKECDFERLNGTLKGQTTNNTRDPDCSRWSNDKEQMCYDCNSCKVGIVAKLREDWRRNIVNGIVLMFCLLTMLSWIGWTAWGNNKVEDLDQRSTTTTLSFENI